METLIEKKSLKKLDVKEYSDGVYAVIDGKAKKLTPQYAKELKAQGYEVPDDGKPKLPEVDVFTRWASYDLFLKMVIEGHRKALIAYGMGGVGKTYICSKNLEKFGMVEFDEEKVEALFMDNGEGKPMVDVQFPAYDYIKITGCASATAVYSFLYEHRDKLVIFDDCDSALKNADSLNILKGALDTSGDGTIVYASSTQLKDQWGRAIPKRFKFKGRVVFISNIKKEEMNQQVISRSLAIDLTMSKDQTMKRLDEIKHLMVFENHKGEKIDVTKSHIDRAVDFFKKYMDVVDLGYINARTVGSVALIIKEIEDSGAQMDWEQVALNVIS